MGQKKLIVLICKHCKQVVAKALPNAELVHCPRCSNGKKPPQRTGKRVA